MTKKYFFSVFITAALTGCANTNFKKPSVPSEITGFYSYTQTFMTATVIQSVQLNADGSGFTCSYSVNSPKVRKVPIKHVGGNLWASSSAISGTGEIKKNSDGSISWGQHSTYQKEKIENTSCG